MDGLRAAKYGVRTAYLVIWAFIILVIAGPVVGGIAPQVGVKTNPGLAVDTQTVEPQLKTMFSNTQSLMGTHQLVVPVHNNWVFPASASLSLEFVVGGVTVYRTVPGVVNLSPFQSGEMNVTISPPVSALSAIQQSQFGLEIRGVLSLQTGNLWNVTVSYP